MEISSNESKNIVLRLITGESNPTVYYETSIAQNNSLDDLLQNLKKVKQSTNDALTKLVNQEKENNISKNQDDVSIETQNEEPDDENSDAEHTDAKRSKLN
uniref:CSON001852 protein n=1 Tax=Culicoides sonorensis TaxID=179676 RepID=A0A336LHU2_CULSO